MLDNADAILGQADDAGVKNATATWVPCDTDAPLDTSGLADHSVCALAAAGLNSDKDSSLLQFVLASVDIPADRPLTKDGKRIFSRRWCEIQPAPSPWHSRRRPP